MNLDHVWEIVRSAWSVLGPFVGIFIGVHLTTRTQKRQWIRDHKRTEYRELLTTIADAGGTFIVCYGVDPVVLTPSQQFEMGETARTSVDVIYNRLFIAKAVEELGIQRRWEEAILLVRANHDINVFGKSLDSIMEDIRKKALEEFS